MIATAGKVELSLDRLLLTSELLQKFATPISTGTLLRAIARQAGRPWSKRTLLRDLQLLRGRGYVVPVGGGKRGAKVCWQWQGARSLLERRPSA